MPDNRGPVIEQLRYCGNGSFWQEAGHLGAAASQSV